MTQYFKYDERWNGASIGEEHWHFHRQLLDRYGIIMGPGDFSHMMERLRSGKALLVRKTVRNRAIYRCRIKSTSEVIFIIATPTRVFTAYPPNKELRARALKLIEKGRLARASMEGTDTSLVQAGDAGAEQGEA